MDPDPRKEIEVDPDLDPERGLKWIRIRIRPNAVDPGGSGSETLLITVQYLLPLVVVVFLRDVVEVDDALVAVEELVVGVEGADGACSLALVKIILVAENINLNTLT